MFSLLEMMVVLAIIGFLAGMLVVNLTAAADEAAVGATKATIKQVEDGLKMYKLKKRKYPDSNEGLDAVVKAGYISGFKDSWQNEIQYAYPGTNGRKFDVWSLGADGLDGGQEFDADIYNGTQEQQE